MQHVMAAAVCLSLLATGCGSDDKGADTGSVDTKDNQNPTGKVTLWSSFTDASEIKAFQPIIDVCEKANPGLEIEYVGKDELGDAVSAAVEARQVPDAIQGDFGGTIASKVAGNQLMSVEELQGDEKLDWKGFVPAAEKISKYQGKHWGIPLSLDTAALFVNLDAYDEAGITDAPDTLDRLFEDAQTLLKVDPDGTIERIGFVPDVGDGSFVPLAGGLFGAQAFSDDGKKVTLDTPEWKASLEWQKKFYDLMDTEKFKRFVDSFGSYDSADNFFIKGQLATYLEASYFATWPERFGNGKPDRWSIAPMPTPDGIADPNKFALMLGSNMFMVPTGAKDPDLSWQAIKCMSTAADAIASLEKTVGNIPANTTALDTFEKDITAKIPQFSTFIDLARSANPTVGQESLAAGTFEDQVTSLALRYRDGEVKDLDAALKETQDKVQSDLDSQQGG